MVKRQGFSILKNWLPFGLSLIIKSPLSHPVVDSNINLEARPAGWYTTNPAIIIN
jgi:hypothetical protein